METDVCQTNQYPRWFVILENEVWRVDRKKQNGMCFPNTNLFSSVQCNFHFHNHYPLSQCEIFNLKITP